MATYYAEQWTIYTKPKQQPPKEDYTWLWWVIGIVIFCSLCAMGGQ